MFVVELLEAADIDLHRADLLALLTDAVNGGASVNFIAPLSPKIGHNFWDKVRGEVANQTRVVLAAVDKTQAHGQIIGCVHLALATTPNGAHRAEVQKLLVHSQHRQKGIGGALMEAAESRARSLGRSLLVLDTESGSTAERLYQRQGFVRSGIIPQYALNHSGTHLIDTVIYYKLI